MTLFLISVNFNLYHHFDYLMIVLHLRAQMVVETKGMKRFTAHFITYEAAMWIVHVVLVTLACADRFTWNVWPRQNTFNIGGKPAGWDKVDGLLDGPWSVKLYDIIVRFSPCAEFDAFRQIENSRNSASFLLGK